MATSTQSMKSKGPAPTVDQINADRITQVRKHNLDVYEIFYLHEYKLIILFCFSLQIGTGHRIP